MSSRMLPRGVGVRSALGLLLLGFVLSAAATWVSAAPGGTGDIVNTDPVGDSIHSAGTDIVRMGAGSDGTYLYLWERVNSADVPTSSDLDGHGHVIYTGFSWGDIDYTDCARITTTMDSSGTATVKSFRIIACESFTPVGTFGTDGEYEVSWQCSELFYKIPLSTLVGPTSTVTTGTTLNFALTSEVLLITNRVYDSVAAANSDTADGSAVTYTVGDPYVSLQNPPGAPTLTPSGDNKVDVKFTKPADNGAMPITSFNIYRDGVKTGSVSVTDTTTTSFTFTDDGTGAAGALKSATAYSYTVKSVNCQGESAASTATSITPEFRPSAPTTLTAGTLAYNSVPLSWGASTDAPSASSTPTGTGATGLKEYQVYRSADATVDESDTKVGTVTTVTTTSFTDTSVSPTTTYNYAVRALDTKDNKGLFSNVVTVTTPGIPTPPDVTKPSTVIGLTASNVLTTSYDLTWSAATDPGSPSSGVSKYEVFCGASATVATTGTPFATVNVPTVTTAITGRTADTDTYCVVRAIDNAGNIGVASAALRTRTQQLPDVTAPPQVTGLALTGATRTGFVATWSLANDPVGAAGERVSGTASYNLYCTAGATPVTTTPTAVLTHPTVTKTLTGLAEDTSYACQVRAVDAAGNLGQLSAIISIRTLPAPVEDPEDPDPVDTTPPSAPVLTAEDTSTTEVDMVWTPATDDFGVTAYDLVVDDVVLATWDPATAGCTATACYGTIIGLGPGTTHSFSVVAHDAAGHTTRSNVVSILMPYEDIYGPLAVTLAAAGLSEHEVGLSWTRAHDEGGSEIASYLVFRSTSPFTEEALEDGPTFEFTPDTQDLVDRGLQTGTTYYYLVVAVDSRGNLGAFSNLAVATTPGAPPASSLLVSASPGTLSISSGETATLQLRVTGGRAPYTCTWTGTGTPAFATKDCLGATLTFAEAGIHAVEVVVRDGSGQSASAIYKVISTEGARPTGLEPVLLESFATADADSDGTPDIADNCPGQANVQLDSDRDGKGDACDGGTPIGVSKPPVQPSTITHGTGGQVTTPKPPVKPVVTNDRDNDGIVDALDNCPDTSGRDENDRDHDGIGDLCDPDTAKEDPVVGCPATGCDTGSVSDDSDGSGDVQGGNAPASSSTSADKSKGWLVPAIVGGLVLLLVAVGAGFFVMRRRAAAVASEPTA